MRATMRVVGGVAALALSALALSGCQEQRNEFNPVRIFCPGDFDPVTNTCVIETGEPPAAR